MTPLEYIGEKGYPVSVRELVNRCASRLNRLIDIVFEDTVSAKVIESEEKVTFIFPRNLSGGSSGRSVQNGFDWFQAPYLGTGTPPASQQRQISVRPGVINGSIVPENMASVFELPNNDTSYLRCTTNQSALGAVTSAELDIATELAPDPPGSLDIAPATSSRPLWRFVTVDNRITSAIAMRRGGLDVLPVAYNVQCGASQVRMLWPPSQVNLAE